MIPFSPDVFFAIFEQYNRAIWPAQWIAYALGVLVILLMFRPTGWGNRLIASLLAGFWIWNAIAYHLFHFSMINFWAYGFALLFLIQGILFLWTGVARGTLAFSADLGRASSQAGLGLMVFALAGYPLLGHLMGRAYPAAPAFGVTPCPLVLFTLGALLMCIPRVKWGPALIPLIWAVVGSTTAWSLGVTEDLTLIFAAAIFSVFAIKDQG